MWLESEAEDNSEEVDQGGGSDGEDPHVNGRVAHIHRMRKDKFFGGEENMESDNGELEVEVELASGSAGAVDGGHLPSAEEGELDFDFESVSLTGANLGGGFDGYTSHCDMAQYEEEEDMQAEYGAMMLVDEASTVFKELDGSEYDDLSLSAPF